MPAKRKKKSTYYTPPRRAARQDDSESTSDSATDSVTAGAPPDATPDTTPDAASGQNQQWVDIGERNTCDFSDHPEIVTTIPALRQGIRTTMTDNSDGSWRVLIQHCVNLLEVTIDLKNYMDPSSKNDLESVRPLSYKSLLEKRVLAEPRTTAVKLPKATAATDSVAHEEFPTQTESENRLYSTKELSEQIDKLTATVEALAPEHGNADNSRRKQPRSYASVLASPRNSTSRDAHKEHTRPVALTKTHHKHTESKSKAKAPLNDKRFILQMETPVDPETFDPVTVRDQLNDSLPCSEVIGAARSRPGNLIITCRRSAAAVLKYQHQWLPRLPPVHRVHDEEKWVRRVVRVHESPPASSPAEINPGRIEREVCEYNSVKLAATPRLLTNSTVLLFLEHEADAPKHLYMFGTRVCAMRYRPKIRLDRRRGEREMNTDTDMG